MSISMRELNNHGYSMDPATKQNLDELLIKINKVRQLYAKPMTITSGLRSMADQQRINPKAPKSKHIMGQACDVLDIDKAIAKWCHANVAALEEIGLWCEDTAYTKNWVHFQTVPPRSGKRFFIP